MGFTKLDSGIIHSSIWSEPVETRVLWITMLALCDENGFVSVSVPGLVRAANVPNETFESAIKTLESPDVYSRTPDNEGRRVEKVDGGWVILNFLKYRSHSEIIKEQTRERVRKFREKKQDVTLGNVTETLPSASVSASSSGINSGINQAIDSQTWRTDFNIYKAECEAAFDAASQNREWLKERKTYHPNLDIGMTLQKAFFDFWGTEAGWKHKKSKKAKDIDWQRTINNAVDLRGNWVYEKKPIR